MTFATKCLAVLLCYSPFCVTDIRISKVVEVLKGDDIKFSTVDLVCFTWLEKKEDEEKDDDSAYWDGEQVNLEDSLPLVKAVEYNTRYTTLPTIWIGVVENTLAGATAHDLSAEILKITRKYEIINVEVGFRESEAQVLSGPALFGPVDDDEHCKDVIDDLSTVLPMSVAGKETAMQGTLTCFFRVGNELYAICARHNFFKDGKDDDEYTFVDCAIFFSTS